MGLLLFVPPGESAPRKEGPTSDVSQPARHRVPFDMSLFKTREWWSTTCGISEEFDQGCMAIGNVDESRDGGSKIVTGSFSGMLRVYAPKESEGEGLQGG